MSDGTPEKILEAEAAGQAELVERSNRLPRESNLSRDYMKSLGIAFGDDVDELFVHVVLPEGWKIEPTGHSMWSNLMDADGEIRAEIFYKAAFYDRRAEIWWKGADFVE